MAASRAWRLLTTVSAGYFLLSSFSALPAGDHRSACVASATVELAAISSECLPLAGSFAARSRARLSSAASRRVLPIAISCLSPSRASLSREGSSAAACGCTAACRSVESLLEPLMLGDFLVASISPRPWRPALLRRRLPMLDFLISSVRLACPRAIPLAPRAFCLTAVRRRRPARRLSAELAARARLRTRHALLGASVALCGGGGLCSARSSPERIRSLISSASGCSGGLCRRCLPRLRISSRALRLAHLGACASSRPAAQLERRHSFSTLTALGRRPAAPRAWPFVSKQLVRRGRAPARARRPRIPARARRRPLRVPPSSVAACRSAAASLSTRASAAVRSARLLSSTLVAAAASASCTLAFSPLSASLALASLIADACCCSARCSAFSAATRRV